MYIKYLLTIVVLLSPTLLISQKKGILLSNCMEKATEIVKQLHHVNGTFIHNQVPEIAIQENSTKLASYKDHTIIIDPSLCELCQSFGERSNMVSSMLIWQDMKPLN